jgi:SAM-dependent methyltransferase
MYATPKRGIALSDCAFYHRLDIPEVKENPTWQWDLIGDEGKYLGNFDFSGKRVLEFGSASGALTFWMEKQGADVVGVDLSPDVEKTSWDMMVMEGKDPVEMRRHMSGSINRLNNGFWYAHEYFESKAKLIHGTAYNVPHEVGLFDVVTLCAILLHLRDPLRAIDNAVSFAKKNIIITDRVPSGMTAEELKRPIALYVTNKNNVAQHGGTSWWLPTPAVYASFLDLKGFDVKSLTFQEFRYRRAPVELFQLVVERRS